MLTVQVHMHNTNAWLCLFFWKLFHFQFPYQIKQESVPGVAFDDWSSVSGLGYANRLSVGCYAPLFSLVKSNTFISRHLAFLSQLIIAGYDAVIFHFDYNTLHAALIGSAVSIEEHDVVKYSFLPTTWLSGDFYMYAMICPVFRTSNANNSSSEDPSNAHLPTSQPCAHRASNNFHQTLSKMSATIIVRLSLHRKDDEKPYNITTGFIPPAENIWDLKNNITKLLQADQFMISKKQPLDLENMDAKRMTFAISWAYDSSIGDLPKSEFGNGDMKELMEAMKNRG